MPKVNDGSTRGAFPSSQVQPPPQLSDVDPSGIVKPSMVGSYGMSDEAIITELVDGYLVASKGLFKSTMMRHCKQGDWSAAMYKAARRISAAGVSARLFVSFVVDSNKKLRGGIPYPEQVFGERAMRAWMQKYLRAGANVMGVQSYSITEERRRMYWERMRLGQQYKIPVQSRL